MIYLDNNATTAIDPRVIDAMTEALAEDFGNPSSAYRLARAPRNKIENARQQVAEFLGAEQSSEIIFTSGGTESDNWAILGALESRQDKKGVVTTTVEHEAIRVVCDRIEASGFEVSRCDVNSDGELDVDELLSMVDEDTAIVSVMLANNETGVLFPVEEIARRVKEQSDALVHVDGVNAAGKVPVRLSGSAIDLFSISGHKFHGPKGVGALYVKSGVDLHSRNIGGGQEFGRRAGTEATHQIVGLGKAAELASDLTPMQAISALREEFEKEVLGAYKNASINGRNADRLPNTSNVSFENLNGELILSILDEKGICVSTGSACNESNHVSSPVLRAMKIPYSRAMGTIRFSFGRNNNSNELPTVLEALQVAISRAGRLAGSET